MGLGVDLVEIERVSRSLDRWGERFISKLMDPREASRLPETDRSVALAVAIAVKEAASKALGTGWSRGVRWRDVDVGPRPESAVQLNFRAAEVARALGSSGGSRVKFTIRDGLVVAEYRLLSA